MNKNQLKLLTVYKTSSVRSSYTQRRHHPSILSKARTNVSQNKSVELQLFKKLFIQNNYIQIENAQHQIKIIEKSLKLQQQKRNELQEEKQILEEKKWSIQTKKNQQQLQIMKLNFQIQKISKEQQTSQIILTKTALELKKMIHQSIFQQCLDRIEGVQIEMNQFESMQNETFKISDNLILQIKDLNKYQAQLRWKIRHFPHSKYPKLNDHHYV